MKKKQEQAKKSNDTIDSVICNIRLQAEKKPDDTIFTYKRRFTDSQIKEANIYLAKRRTQLQIEWRMENKERKAREYLEKASAYKNIKVEKSTPFIMTRKQKAFIKRKHPIIRARAMLKKDNIQRSVPKSVNSQQFESRTETVMTTKVKIDDRMTVYWPTKSKWIIGKVTDIDTNYVNAHNITFRNGEHGWMDLSKEKFLNLNDKKRLCLDQILSGVKLPTKVKQGVEKEQQQRYQSRDKTIVDPPKHTDKIKVYHDQPLCARYKKFVASKYECSEKERNKTKKSINLHRKKGLKAKQHGKNNN